MAVENISGSRFMDGLDNSSPPEQAHGALLGGRVRCVVETLEVDAAASATSTYRLGKIPSNARILPMSKLHYDDLASAGAPTVDVGLFGDNITDDDNCLADGIDVAAAAGSTALNGGDIANAGLPAWDLVAGETEDPREMLDVIATLKDAAVNVGGTITLELYYAER